MNTGSVNQMRQGQYSSMPGPTSFTGAAFVRRLQLRPVPAPRASPLRPANKPDASFRPHGALIRRSLPAPLLRDEFSDDDVDFIYATMRTRLDAVDGSTDPVPTWVKLFGDVRREVVDRGIRAPLDDNVLRRICMRSCANRPPNCPSYSLNQHVNHQGRAARTWRAADAQGASDAAVEASGLDVRGLASSIGDRVVAGLMSELKEQLALKTDKLVEEARGEVVRAAEPRVIEAATKQVAASGVRVLKKCLKRRLKEISTNSLLGIQAHLGSGNAPEGAEGKSQA